MTDSILLSLSLPSTDIKELNEEIEEMKQLAFTMGYQIQSSIIQKRVNIDSSTYFGKGKIESIINQCKELKYNTLFINDELQPGHFKRIQKLAGEKIMVVDRTKLILDIFNDHARTVEAKKQIELASIQYMMPRLIGQWTHLERQMGGIGTRGGPGEKQIEIDRRLLRKDITKLKKDLLIIEKQKQTQRKSRKDIYKVAFAGYTNAGKSSLLKALSGYDAFIKDQLFATLDTTTKKIQLNDGTKILLSDTVGFLRKLPHDLIASFRSTLGEIENADLIIKLIDINSTDIKGHIKTIDDTLELLNCNNHDSIIVFNKIDKMKDISIYNYLNTNYKNAIFISSLKKLKINNLLEVINNYANEKLNEYEINIPYNKTYLINKIYKKARVLSRIDDFEFIKINIKASEKFINLIKKELNDL
tara:strand:- start:2338 stop:3588 length:1251 start_codon:yes stop_codon:yes gene_type:complete